MKFMAIAETDVGITKSTNQDSVLVKHVRCALGEVILSVICDGMGGLSKGELASAAVVKEFSRWFDNELPFELENLDFQIISQKWSLLLKDLNADILEYGNRIGISLGTTFTGFLAVDDKFLIGHVGDTRAYYIGSYMSQLTQDQTFVAREVDRGTMTLTEAMTDKRRNMLLQCVGASNVVEPEMIQGTCRKGAYLLCSDGFRHEITDSEMFESLNPVNLVNKEAMQSNVRYLIEENKRRMEQDNISAILIKAY